MNWVQRIKAGLCALSLCGIATAAEIKSAPMIDVWIDTDPAVGVEGRDIDDGVALLQSFHSPELKIHGVSVVFGNAPLKQAWPIAQHIVKKFGPVGLPVYRGAASSAALGVENAATRALAKRLLRTKMTLLVLGPATNIATVVKRHPELHSRIDSIVTVAGRRPGQRFTVGPNTQRAFDDFNFEQDAEAFRVLLESKIPITLAPFEISSKVWIRSEDFRDWAAAQSPESRWLIPAADGWLKVWREQFGVSGFNPFDTLAVGVLTHPSFMTCSELPVEIRVLENDNKGESAGGKPVLAQKPYLLVDKNFSSLRRVRYCYEAHSSFKNELMQRLTKLPFQAMAEEAQGPQIKKIEKIYEGYQRQFPAAPETSATWLRSHLGSEIVLVDVREDSERKVSILPGAISQAEFEANKAKFMEDNVVVYCTVGLRSGLYVKRLMAEGIRASNLRGGVLSWAHAGGDFIDANRAPTKRVHVYGKEWNLLPKDYEAIW